MPAVPGAGYCGWVVLISSDLVPVGELEHVVCHEFMVSSDPCRPICSCIANMYLFFVMNLG